MHTELSSPSLSSEAILNHVADLTGQLQRGCSLAELLPPAIATLRIGLAVDRVLVFQHGKPKDVAIAIEMAPPEYAKVLPHLNQFPGLDTTWLERCNQGQLIAIADRHAEPLPTEFMAWLEHLNIHAQIIAPILSWGDLWGFLLVQHCDSPRSWHSLELQYVRHITQHLGLAVQQTVASRSAPSSTPSALAPTSASPTSAAPLLNPDSPSSVVLTLGDPSTRYLAGGACPMQGAAPTEAPDRPLGSDLSSTPVHTRAEALQDQLFQQSLLHTIAETCPLAFYVVDHTTDHILYANSQFYQIWGLPHLSRQIRAGHLTHREFTAFCLPLLRDRTAFLTRSAALQESTLHHAVNDVLFLVDGRQIRRFSSPLQTPQGRPIGRLYIFEDISDRQHRNNLIQQIAQGVSAQTGTAFFRSLVEFLITTLGVEHAFVSELLENGGVKVLAGLSGGESFAGFEYHLEGTPCKQVVQQGFCFYPSNIQQLFPEDLILQQLGGEGYVGTCLVNSTGTEIGLLCVISNYPILNADFIQEIITIFAVRAASELERQQAEAKLQRYERIVSAIPDCVSVINQDYIYQVVNHTYLMWNRKTYNEIVGHSVSDLLGQKFFEAHSKPLLDRCLAGEAQQVLETWQEYPDGRRRFVRATYSPYIELDGRIAGVVINVHDLTALKQIEEALRDSEVRFRQMATSIHEVFWMADIDFSEVIYVSPAYEDLWGQPRDRLYASPTAFLEAIHPDDRDQVIATVQHSRLTGFSHEYRLLRPNGEVRWIWERAFPVMNPAGHPYRLVGVSQDISDRKQAELALRQHAERQFLLSQVAQHIRQTLDLDSILQTTVTEVRQFLHTDRVIIYRFNSDWSGVIIAEAVTPAWRSILGMPITDTYFVDTQGQSYGQGRIRATNDIYNAGLDDCHITLLEQMQVRAKLVVPIVQDQSPESSTTRKLWGLLVAQQCSSTRHWEPWEIELQQQLATQIAIAIQQADLYQRSQQELVDRQRAEAALKQLNQDLEQRVQERTQALKQQAEQERLLRVIVQHIHQSLDLDDILTAVLNETRYTFHADRVAIYQFQPDWSGQFVAESVGAGWQPLVTNAMQLVWEDTYLQDTQGGCFRDNRTVAIADIYAADHAQCHVEILEQFQARAYAIAPIFMDDKLWGLLAVYQNHAPRQWQEWEISLLRQIAIQTAIALRQSRLYQAAQTQVKELERLSQLKDDFLSTVSHELRSPMSSIKMATQMLEISLERLGILEDHTSAISRYFKVLKEEGKREINLINDLLDLARLDAGTEPLTLTPINLSIYVPYLAQSFMERAQQQQQQLQLHIPDELPVLTTDQAYLERIITELLHNACKYTPANESIVVTIQPRTAPPLPQGSPGLDIQICNTGVEIPSSEHDRIFDKFYRIPKNDPWKHGGTGLGLALVKKLVERLGGTIQVGMIARQTTFILWFPLKS